MKYMKNAQVTISTIFVAIVLLSCNDKKFYAQEEFVLETEINLTEFFNSEISRQFAVLSSNELGKYCSLSFDVEGEKLFLPSRVSNEIKEYAIKPGEVKAQKVIKTQHSPLFIDKKKDSWVYSSMDDNCIHEVVNGVDAKIIGDVDPLFKNCNGEIIYNSSFSFFNLASRNDSNYYENIYNDWDYYYLGDKSLLILEMDHEGDGDYFLKVVNSGKENRKIIVEKAGHYHTCKCLGVINNKVLLLLADAKTIEFIVVDLDSFTVSEKVQRRNPFKTELMLGDYSSFWPNQFICKYKDRKVYLMGTGREKIQLYSLALDY